MTVVGRDSHTKRATRRLFSGGLDNEIRVWDALVDSAESQLPQRELALLRGHTGGIRTLEATSATLFSGSADMTIRVWDVTSKEKETYPPTSNPNRL